MSYTTGTTHYNLPQTVGSDKRDWTDTNEAFSDVDAALWEAHQGATQAALDIASINSEIQTITGKQADDEADIATISGKVSTLETTVANHTTEIGDVRRDLQDNIESRREDTATSTHAYEIGDYFYYNDVLFKATAQIAIGATIVPNTNCTGVTVMSEMAAGGASPDASQVSYDNTTSGLTADDVQEAVDELAAEKIDTFSGSVADASQNTYTAVTADGIAYDATNDQLLLKVNGADTVIPFNRGGHQYAHHLMWLSGPGIFGACDFDQNIIYDNPQTNSLSTTYPTAIGPISGNTITFKAGVKVTGMYNSGAGSGAGGAIIDGVELAQDTTYGPTSGTYPLQAYLLEFD